MTNCRLIQSSTVRTPLQRRRRYQRDDGFTLVELLVVLIIIGILAAVAIPLYLSQQSKGYDASAKSDIRVVARELETYNADANSYPNAATNPSPVVVGGVTLKSSPGNSVSWFLNPTKTAFCVVTVNAKGTRPWEYISSLGGLQPSSTFAAGTTLPTACSTSSY